ncbi:MAG: hypothetical protein AAF320_01965 [Myxococcota bacterium]
MSTKRKNDTKQLSAKKTRLALGAVVIAFLTAWVVYSKVNLHKTSLFAFSRALEIMQELYPDNRLPSRIPQQEKDLINQANNDVRNKSSVYGELKLEGIHTILQKLRLGPKDTLYDLGSGQGRLVMLTYLTTKANARGIELSQTRHNKAEEARKRLKSMGLYDSKRLEYRLGDVLNSKFDDATVVFVCDTLFNHQLRQGILDRLLAIKHKVTIVSLKRMPLHPRLYPQETLFVPATWNDAVPVHVYHVFPASASPAQSPSREFVKRDLREIKYNFESSIFYKRSGDIDQREQQAILATGHNPQYSELTLADRETLIGAIGFRKGDRLLVLGNGIGKFALHAYMSAPVSRIVGIEISTTRHSKSMRILRKAFSQDWAYIDPQPYRKVTFLHGDFLQDDFHDRFQEATVLYAASQYYSATVVQNIVDKALQVPHAVKLILFQELPAHPRLRKIKQLQVSTADSATVPVYMYETALPK